MLDQLIRKHIQRYLNETKILSEDNIKTESGWDFVIPDANSLRGQKADQLAKQSGAITGLMIIASRRSYKFFGYNSKNKKTFNDAALSSDVEKMFDFVAKKYFPTKYDPSKTLFIYFKVLDKSNKKIWNVWAVDKDSSGINKISTEWKSALQKSTYYVQSELQINKIQSVALMNYSQATSWFSTLEKAKQDLNLNTKLNLPNLNSIKTNVDIESESLESQEVYVDQTGNVVDSKGNPIDVVTYGFTDGTAEMKISPDGESIIIKPLNGTQGIREFDTNRTGIFTGEFKNGAPFKGLIVYDNAKTDEIQQFNGEVESKIRTVGDQQDFEFNKIKGKATLANGIIFNGDFKNDDFWNGEVFNNKGQAIGHYENGKYERGLKYPLDWKVKDTVFIVYEKGDKVFLNIDNSWGELEKTYFEKEVFFTEDISNVKGINDPKEISKLNKEFKGIESKEDAKITPSPEPKPKPSGKKKYIRIISSSINLYSWSGSDFKIEYKNNSVNVNKTSETDYVYRTPKKGTIQGGSTTQYTFYPITIQGTKLWIPSKFVKIIEK